ncbi:MAG: hypothetical protein ACK4OP_11015 [Gemmobacter sp.]
MTHDDDETLAPNQVRARLMASPPRRVIATAMIAALGMLILYLAVTVPPASLGWRLFLLASGALCLWLAVRLWNATGIALELTGTELREAGGRVLARLDDIDTISRGAFALKPSNGFTLVLLRSAPAVWAPGLWWRLGRRIGVGGVTGRFDSRRMADTLAAAVAARRNR